MGILRAPHLSSTQQELLRWIALTCMVIDHVAFIFLDRETAQPLRAIGRIAWPLFAFLLAVVPELVLVPPDPDLLKVLKADGPYGLRWGRGNHYALTVGLILIDPEGDPGAGAAWQASVPGLDCPLPLPHEA